MPHTSTVHAAHLDAITGGVGDLLGQFAQVVVQSYRVVKAEYDRQRGTA